MRRHAWAGALVLGLVLFFVDQQALVDTADPNFLPSVILLGASVVPFAFVLFVAGRRLP